jgi:hypothetical protein
MNQADSLDWTFSCAPPNRKFWKKIHNCRPKVRSKVSLLTFLHLLPSQTTHTYVCCRNEYPPQRESTSTGYSNKRKNESALRIHNSFSALQEQVHPSTKTYYLLRTITMSLVVSSWEKIKAIDSYDEVAGEMLFKR